METRELAAKPGMHSLKRIASFTTIIAAGFVLGRVSGLAREMIVSARFGLSADLDAYFLAYVVPTVINNIVAGGSITVAVMPVFARYLAHGDRAEFWRVASIITNFLLVVTGALTLLCILFASPIIAILGSGLAAPTQTLASALLVIMMPTLFLNAALNMLLAMLNALDRFVGPALIYLALNVGIIVAVIALAPVIGVYSVAWGFLFGVALQTAIQFVALRREHPQFAWQIDLRHPALRQVALAFVPVTALSILAQINFAVDKAMAGTLATGSISALSYADTITGTFYMLGVSVGIAVFPALSRMVAMDDLANAAHAITASLRMLLFVLAPLTCLLILFAAPTIGLVLGRGKFDTNAVNLTAQALAMYAIGLMAIAVMFVLQRAFYALRDNATPFVVGAVGAAVHVALNWVLMRDFAHAGIALSTSLTAIASALVMLVLLARRLDDFSLTRLGLFLLRCGALAVPSAAFVAWLFALTGLGDETFGARAVGIAFAGLGGLIYLGLAFLLRVPESALLFKTARDLLTRFPVRR
ncbi:MAG: murein biosynthesis integral membrane protein MurJ [Chloroflexi bacterium]|nr:murein biosynthesis integral membrane protein MurJ [Chloroflexota bacterium]